MLKPCILILSIFIFYSCKPSTTSDLTKQTKMIPDHTPYISGLVEATDDTVHHFPEVVVGYMSDVVWDTDDWHHPEILRNYPRLYNPTLWTQVVKTSQYFGFGYKPETEAEVIVTGPLDHPNKQSVRYFSLGNGVYGDAGYSLPLFAGERYKLKVTLPDERTYTAETIIPGKVDIPIPDSININVVYKPYGDGTPREEHQSRYLLKHPIPEDEFLTVRQWNTSIDRELLLQDPNEEFRFNDRSPYIRSGFYGISMSDQKEDSLLLSWGQDLNKMESEVWNKVSYWLRFSFFSEGIGRRFHPISNWYSLSGDLYDQVINDPFAENAAERDTTYLFEVSTLEKMSPTDNSFLPKDSLDAIGFFGGYYSVYKKTTVFPIRHFDLDTVLTQ